MAERAGLGRQNLRNHAVRKLVLWINLPVIDTSPAVARPFVVSRPLPLFLYMT
jgi:hypothetical protein